MELISFLPPDAEVTLTDCDREPIHIPGAIQPHGMLLVLRGPELIVSQVSANVAGFAGRDPGAVLDRPLEGLVGVAQAEALSAWLRRTTLDAPVLYDRPVMLSHTPDVPYYALVHRTEAGVVLELEPGDEADPSGRIYPDSRLDQAILRLRQARSLRALCQAAVEDIREMTGLDSVMAYRFDADWHGEVIAEDRAEHMPSYLGLHFPATDIPAQARRLYVLNRTRLIADAGYTPAPLVPAMNPATGRPLDLSHSALRSVSPIHVEYLGNIGVQASMSISIVHEDKLWGLFVCHHARPVHVPYPIRAACALLGQVLALLIESQREMEERKQESRLRGVQANLLEQMMREDNFLDGLTARSPNMLDVVRARGAAVVREDACATLGQTPPDDAIRALCRWLMRRGPATDDLFVTDELARVYPAGNEIADVASGVVAAPLSRRRQAFLLWFRPEEAQTVYWAGNPNKAVSMNESDDGQRLHPRKSFEAWKEVRRGRAEPWQAGEVRAVRDLLQAIFDVVFIKVEEKERLNEALRAANARLADQNRELRDYAFDTIREPHLVLDRELRVVSANRSYYRFFQAREEDVLGRPLDEIDKAAWGDPRLNRTLRRTLETGAPVDDYEHEASFAHLGPRVMQLDARRLERPDDPEEMLLVSVSDITEKRQAERHTAEVREALRRANEELRQRNEEMEQFTYTVSHDLKTPLVTIAGFGQMLETYIRKGDSDKTTHALERIRNAVDRMTRLIDELLELSRIGRARGELTDVDPAEVVEEVRLDLRHRLERAGAVVQVDGSLPSVRADAVRLGEIFENLFTNALKYAVPEDDEPLRITVSGEVEGGEVRLRVADNGPGIPPEYHDRIFRLFERLHGDERGTGIGLTVVEKIMRVHGGRVWVESEPGAGASFILAFPADNTVE